MHRVFRFTVILIALNTHSAPIFAQLEYVPPIFGEVKNQKNLSGVIILNTTDYHDQYGAPKHYPSTLQVIDPLHPWPPIFFTNALPGGKGLLGQGYYTDFIYHELNHQLSFYTTIVTGQNPVGTFLISDINFKILDTISGDNFNADSHDFHINSRGERLYMLLVDTVLNLVSLTKNPADTAMLVTSQVIVIDDINGYRVFQWNPFDHIPVTESYRKFNDIMDNNPFTKGWDWQHGNSASFTHDGNIAYSFRFLGVGKINRQTGKIMWKLGGKKPTIPVPKGGEYYLQHNFEEIAPDVYSVFSNGGKGVRPCRAIVYRINEKTSTAQVIRKYEPASPVLSISLGNYQTLNNGLCVFNYGKYASLEQRQRMFEIIDTSGQVRAEYTSPSLNFAYTVQYVPKWLPIQPVIMEEGGKLQVSGINYSVIWYLLFDSGLVQVGQGFACVPEQAGTYIAITKAGFGWLASKPYVFSK